MHHVTFKGVVAVPKVKQITTEPFDETYRVLQIAHTYDPFETETGLFLRFAELRSTSETDNNAFRISDFAGRYGLVSNSLSEWRDRIKKMADKVERWRDGQDDLFVIEKHPFSIYCPVDDDEHHMNVVTEDLWTCLRLQFNLAVINKWQFRDCAHCGKPFAIIPPATRKHRVYCSIACSSAAYRKRKKAGTTKKKGTKRVTSTKQQPKTKGKGRGRGKKK